MITSIKMLRAISNKITPIANRVRNMNTMTAISKYDPTTVYASSAVVGGGVVGAMYACYEDKTGKPIGKNLIIYPIIGSGVALGLPFAAAGIAFSIATTSMLSIICVPFLIFDYAADYYSNPMSNKKK